MAYTKLFSSIVTSTIWSENDRTRIVWITMLAICDKNGEVQGSIPGLARIAGVPVEDCRSAIATFLAPDPDSRTKDDEGRRIEEIDGGWLLLNHRKYREMASGEDRLRSAAERQARLRERQKRNAQSRLVTHESRTSNAPVTHESLQNCQADADAKSNTHQTPIPPPPPAAPLAGFDEFWNLYPRKASKQNAMKSWKQIEIQDHQKIMANVAKRMRQDPQWIKDNGTFIPHPSSYLNQKRWLDEFMPAFGSKPSIPADETPEQKKEREKREEQEIVWAAMQ